MSFRTGLRSDPLPLPTTETWTPPESLPGKGVGGHEGPKELDGFEARSDRLLDGLRRDPTITDHSSGDYDTILDSRSESLGDKRVTQSHERDDLLVEKLVATQDPDLDPEVERAVSLARDTAVLDQVVNEVSDGRIAKLSEQVSAKTLAQVKAEVVDAIRSEPGPIDAPPIGKSARNDPEVVEKAGVLARVKAAVTRTIKTIRDAVMHAPIQAVAKEVKAFSKARLSGVPEQEVLRRMGAQIGKLDNGQLLKLYRTTLSLDMVDYRLHLASRAEAGPEVDPEACALLEQLNSYEAMVHAEVIERSLQPAPEIDGFQPIDHGPKLGQLGALAGTEKRAANRELAAQSDAYLSGDPWALRTDDPDALTKVGPTGLTVGQVSDALRSADLTVNVGPKLFAKGGPFRDEKGALLPGPRLKNIFELTQAKGPLYLERRKLVEHALEPATQRADRGGIDPGNHPISAGVNVGRKIEGAARGYGEIVLVLKDSVKERCTYTASDSFNAPFAGARVTPEKIALFKAKVDQMMQPGGGLTEAERQRLLDRAPALGNVFAELDQMVGQGFPSDQSVERFLMFTLLRDIDGDRSTGLKYKLGTAAMECFMDKPPHGSDHVTTPDRMSHIIADLNQNMVDALATGVQDEQRINLPINSYIEAQVYGGIDLANDVAEIRFVEKDTSQMTPEDKEAYLDSLQGMRQMADELGIRVVRYQPDETALTHF